jgi:hypothetical protein
VEQRNSAPQGMAEILKSAAIDGLHAGVQAGKKQAEKEIQKWLQP